MKFFENWKQMNLENQKKLIQQVDDGYIVSIFKGKYKLKDLEEVSFFLHKYIKNIIYILFIPLFICVFALVVAKHIFLGLVFFIGYHIANIILLIYLISILFIFLDDLEKASKWIYIKNLNPPVIKSYNNFIGKIISFPFVILHPFFKLLKITNINQLLSLISNICLLIIIFSIPSLFFANGLYNFAVKGSSLYLKIKPDSVKNYELRGLSKVGLNDIEGAKEDFIKGYEISKKDQDKLNFLYYIINTNLDLGNKKEALENLEEYKKLDSNKLKPQKYDMLFIAAMLGDIESQKVISIIDKKLPKTDCNEDKNKLLFYKALMNKIINTDESLEQSINDLNLLEQNNSCKYEKAAIANMKANIYEQMGNYCKAIEEYDRACEISKKCPPINEGFLYDYARYKCVKEK